MAEQTKFKAEIRELLEMMINSVYSNREIFLRELVANAADAIDKRRFLALTHPEFACDGEIRIIADPKENTLTIRDNGIGMDEKELKSNLGTIAHSGTRQFAEQLRKAKESAETAPELIGQFGVGFYSAFMAADRVVVLTRKVGESRAFQWESDGKETYLVVESVMDQPGTSITLHLKEAFKQ